MEIMFFIGVAIDMVTIMYFQMMDQSDRCNFGEGCFYDDICILILFVMLKK